MMNKIEHIGIAVKDLQMASEIYSKLLGVSSYKKEEVKSEQVITEFFKIGDSKIELLASLNQGSAIAKFIEKRGEGIHHIAFHVEDIYAEMQRLTNEGFILLNDKPKVGADNKLICFMHPKSANGVLVELCQDI
ncbi:MAG: methylmalonyl-CoA epimerase [Bacteroidetes bacterium]|nr:methylmalonyl-CoA epimerase [Bacteroidota bacterium]MBU1371282.1 methylmalonyl-CoA epimerase [Bacteroidota bacterium]MBU1485769.1 methylmalonyl-CoA epimerase [Bacteroidota bacterium]MBU1759553.1 methylmalonyl-CoA epimerase [Bacteroidota bacterium]MBU2047355.1 methylmalonyl-CoA epimerase [Bacteroidota bacterium]